MAEVKTSFEHWALVELFGHQRIAGKVTEAEIGGGKFIRVDVPAIGGQQPITKYYGPAAIYGITPVTEETAIALAGRIDAMPVPAWDARQLLGDKVDQRSLPHPDDDDDQYEKIDR
jgi:hypothetical protein